MGFSHLLGRKKDCIKEIVIRLSRKTRAATFHHLRTLLKAYPNKSKLGQKALVMNDNGIGTPTRKLKLIAEHAKSRPHAILIHIH
ncbi:hypothetical protein V6N12_068963 [Hibiscus sabdariffa]|uniref:Transposase n=1 Tax=Hibiscus sabdariffa TaxID=183260 RepID=A0ABR2CCB0_9ROSI